MGEGTNVTTAGRKPCICVRCLTKRTEIERCGITHTVMKINDSYWPRFLFGENWRKAVTGVRAEQMAYLHQQTRTDS